MIINTPHSLLTLLICMVLGYALGSIPFGLIISRMAGFGDVRKIGSGNIGATNVLRTGSKWAAAATLLCDGGKGAVAVIAARLIFGGATAAAAAGFFAVLGHIFPLWLKFKGGKGVATSLGTMLAFFWPAGLAMAATWLVVAKIWKISSLSALVAIVLTPAYAILFGDLTAAALALIIALTVLCTHHENIRRLLSGKEPRIGQKSASQGEAGNG